jgi:outer membrane immunogenic protein
MVDLRCSPERTKRMYRKILLTSVGAMALTASAAFAADLPSPPVYLPPVPVFTWTGFYIGGQVGYAWARDNGSINNPAPPAAVVATAAAFGIVLPPTVFLPFTTNPQGVIGGAHVGYNLQINQWVVGLEGSVDGTSVNRTVFAGAFCPLFCGNVTTKAEIQGSIRGRAGIAFDRVLIYATGGAAFAGIKNFYNTNITIPALPGGPLFGSVSKTRTGWTVGGGIEYAVTNNWSVGAEYRYSDFGRYNDFSATAGVPGAFLFPGSFIRHHITENQVQARVSYKFDSLVPTPVVAKY